MQRLHPYAQIARGKYSLGKSHHSVSHQPAPAGEAVVHYHIAIYPERMVPSLELRSTRKCERPGKCHRRKEPGQEPSIEIGEAQIRVAVGKRVGDGRFDLSRDV